MLTAKYENVEKFQTKCGKAIEEFLEEMAVKSKNTANNYKSDITRFLDKVFDTTIDLVTVETLDRLDFELFKNYRESFGDVKNTTINRHLSCIKKLYKNLKYRSILKSDISYLELVTQKNNDATEIEYMPKAVVEQYIYEAKHEKFNSEEKERIIFLAADQGFRLEELLNLTWKNFIEQEDGVMIKTFGKGNTKVRGKISYDVYARILHLKKDDAQNDDKVFANLSTKTVGEMMRRIRKSLGYEHIAYSFHSLRKSAVTFGYRLTGDILEAQRIAGHADLSTTQIYTQAIDYGVMGMFSLGNHDSEAYKKLSHEELLEVLSNMNKDMIHLLNTKIGEYNK